MEEILASIKRVIREPGQPAAAPRTQRSESRPPADAADENVLELGEPASPGDGLVSENAAEASRQSLSALSGLHGRGGDLQGDGPLEAVVREMLRPMLKEWLDQNLPDIVQALVTREIARITGKSF